MLTPSFPDLILDESPHASVASQDDTRSLVVFVDRKDGSRAQFTFLGVQGVRYAPRWAVGGRFQGPVRTLCTVSPSAWIAEATLADAPQNSAARPSIPPPASLTTLTHYALPSADGVWEILAHEVKRVAASCQMQIR